jgi:hypothetical protein
MTSRQQQAQLTIPGQQAQGGSSIPGSTKLIGGLGGAIGCAFLPSTHKLVLVEFATGKLDAVDLATSTLRTLGTGYSQPESVVVASDGDTAYVTEATGNLLSVSLGNAARSSARVIASGLNTPQQIALDEAHSCAYMVEFASPGRLLRIDLTSGAITVITAGLEFAVGVAITSDLSTAYVSEQPSSGGGRIRTVALATGVVSSFVTGLTNPFFLTWINSSQQGLFVPERDPANHISVVSTTGGAPVIAVSPVAFRPSSVAVPAPGQLLIACDAEIDTCSLLPVSSGNLLLGIVLEHAEQRLRRCASPDWEIPVAKESAQGSYGALYVDRIGTDRRRNEIGGQVHRNSRLAPASNAESARSARLRHSCNSDNRIHSGSEATVNATPSDGLPACEKAQSSAARKSSILGAYAASHSSAARASHSNSARSKRF